MTTSQMVFSIRPRFVSAFRNGTKRFEFRTRRPDVDGEVVLIYETAPTSAIVASATVYRIVVGTPAEIWDEAGEFGGISRNDFDGYFDGRQRAVAIELLGLVWLPEPRKLPAGMTAPQAWSRLRGVCEIEVDAGLQEAESK